MEALKENAQVKEGIDPYMNLSFVSLVVIGDVRLLPGGPFNVKEWRMITPEELEQRYKEQGEGKKQVQLSQMMEMLDKSNKKDLNIFLFKSFYFIVMIFYFMYLISKVLPFSSSESTFIYPLFFQ